MPLLRPISIFLRNVLIRQHPYFSCCASCGEIKTPLADRLCTSLLPDFPVDAVIVLPAGNAVSREKVAVTLHSLIENAPWLRRIHLLASELPEGIVEEKLSLLPPASLVPQNAILPPQGYLHTVPDLVENYLVVPAGFQIEQPLLVVDFFTPNGIPLLFLQSRETGAEPIVVNPDLGCALEAVGLFLETALRPALYGIAAQCKENSAAFLTFAAALPPLEAESYPLALAHFAYAAGRVVPKNSNIKYTFVTLPIAAFPV